MISEQQIQVTTTETKLLYDIRELLREQNELLKRIAKVDDLEGLAIEELRERVRALPVKPKGWNFMKAEELRKLLVKG